MTEPRWLVSLTVPPELEETIVDWLLERESSSGFTSFPVSGHSSHPEGLSLAEQVSGRKRQIRFEMHLPEPAVTPILEQLRQDFRGAGIHYWTMPIGHYGKV